MGCRFELHCFYVERDKWSNVYRALTITDLETSKSVSFDMGAQTTDSNIYAIKYYWQKPYGWYSDSPIQYKVTGMKERAYNHHIKGWERTSKTGKELVALIKKRLGIKDEAGEPS